MTQPYNRLRQFIESNPNLTYLSHGPYSKVADESSLAVSTVTRLRLAQVKSPSFIVVVRLTEFFEKQYGLRIDPREIIYPGGYYQPLLSFAGGDLIRHRPTRDELERLTQENPDREET